MNIFSSEKDNIKQPTTTNNYQNEKESALNWKATLQKLSLTETELLNEHRARERAFIEHNIKEYHQHEKNINILQLKHLQQQRILFEQKITEMQYQLEDKNRQINQLKSNQQS